MFYICLMTVAIFRSAASFQPFEDKNTLESFHVKHSFLSVRSLTIVIDHIERITLGNTQLRLPLSAGNHHLPSTWDLKLFSVSSPPKNSIKSLYVCS